MNAIESARTGLYQPARHNRRALIAASKASAASPGRRHETSKVCPFIEVAGNGNEHTAALAAPLMMIAVQSNVTAHAGSRRATVFQRVLTALVSIMNEFTAAAQTVVEMCHKTAGRPHGVLTAIAQAFRASRQISRSGVPQLQ